MGEFTGTKPTAEDYENTHTNNKWGVSIKDPKERQIAFQSYCDHISKGNDKMSWTYENEKTGSHWTHHTMEKWIKTTDEFDARKLEIAHAKSFAFYEKHLKDSITGDNTKVNIAGLQMALRNKFGWDRPDKRQMDVPELLANYERVMLLLAERQRKPSTALESPSVEAIEHSQESSDE